MIIFLDTDVLIDCLRGTTASQTWLNTITPETFYVPGIVAMELIVGCKNRIELQRIQKFLDTFTIIWPQEKDFSHAYQLLVTYQLSNKLGIPDCLVAAMTLNHDACLYTFNTKHFQIITQLDIKKPFIRI